MGTVACNKMHLATPIKESGRAHTCRLLTTKSSTQAPIVDITTYFRFEAIKRTQDVLGAVKESHNMASMRRHAHPHKLSELDDIEIQKDDRLGEIDTEAGEGRDVNDPSESLRESGGGICSSGSRAYEVIEAGGIAHRYLQ